MAHWFHEYLRQHFTDSRWSLLWDMQGECLMSGVETLDDNEGTMILGLNPGGTRLPALKDQVALFFRDCTKDWSCYLDQCWHAPTGKPRDRCEKRCPVTGPIVKKLHQRRVAALAEEIGCNLHRTVAMNAFFTETPSTQGLQEVAHKVGLKTPHELFREAFSPVIQHMIGRSGIRRVICLGNGRSMSAYSLMAEVLGADSEATWERESRDGRFFETDRVRVASIPHPSWPTKLSDQGREDFKKWYQGASIEARAPRE